MSTKAKSETDQLIDSAGGLRSEPVGRAQRPAGGAPAPGVELLPQEVRDRLSDELIDELLAGARTEEEIVGPGGVLAQLTKRLVERAMSAELSEHLGSSPTRSRPAAAATAATARRRRRLRASRERCGSKRRGTATAASSRSSSGRPA